MWNPGIRLYKHTGEPIIPLTELLPSGTPGEIRPAEGKPPSPEIDLEDELVRRSLCSRLPAEREVLRSVLLRDLDQAHVHFSAPFQRANVSDDGVRAESVDGSTSPLGSILIGADGAFSKVATQTLGDMLRPKPTGHKVIYGRCPLTPELESALLPGIDKAIHFAIGPGGVSPFIEAIRFDYPDSPNDYIFWVLNDPTGFNPSIPRSLCRFCMVPWNWNGYQPRLWKTGPTVCDVSLSAKIRLDLGSGQWSRLLLRSQPGLRTDG